VGKEHQSRLEQRDRALYLLHQISFPGVGFEEIKYPFRDGSAKSVKDVDHLVAKAMLEHHDNKSLWDEMALDELTEIRKKLEADSLALPHNDHESLKEQQYFFNRPEANADYPQSAGMAYWTIEEAVALSYGKKPHKVTAERLSRLVGLMHPFPGEYINRVDQVQRAVHTGDLSEPIKPSDFITWASGVGLTCPPRLLQLVCSKYTPQIQATPPTDSKLNWEEITITFLKDNLIEIDIRGKATRHSAAILGLLNKKSGALTRGGVFLLGLAQGLRDKLMPAHHKPMVSDLRKTLKGHFKIDTNPISFEKGLGYRSRIHLQDKTKAADKRAEAQAYRTQRSLDELGPNVIPSAEGHDYAGDFSFTDDLDDAASDFLRKRLKGESDD
jgi:hypothetical protein